MERADKIELLKAKLAALDAEHASISELLHRQECVASLEEMERKRDAKEDGYKEVEVTWGNLKFKGMPVEDFFVDAPGVVPFLDEEGTRIGKAFCKDGVSIEVVVDDAETMRRIMDPTVGISVGYSASDEGAAELASAQFIGLGGSRAAFDAGGESARAAGVDVQTWTIEIPSFTLPTWEMVTKYSAIGRNKDGGIAACWMLERSGPPGRELELTYRGRLHADGSRPDGMKRNPWWGFHASVLDLAQSAPVFGSAMVVRGDVPIDLPLRLWMHQHGPLFVGEASAPTPIGADMCLVSGSEPGSGSRLLVGRMSVPCPAEGPDKLMLERMISDAIQSPVAIDALVVIEPTAQAGNHKLSKISGILGMPVAELAADCRGMGITIHGDGAAAELSDVDVAKVWSTLTRRHNIGGQSDCSVREVLRSDAHGNKRWERDPPGHVDIEPCATLTVAGIVAEFANGGMDRHAAESALRVAFGLTEAQIERALLASDAAAADAAISRLFSECKTWLIQELKGLACDVELERISARDFLHALELMLDCDEVVEIRDAEARLKKIRGRMDHSPGDDERRDKAMASMECLKRDSPAETKSSAIIQIGDTTVIVDGAKSFKVTSLKIVRVTGSRDSIDITFDCATDDRGFFEATSKANLPVTLTTDSLAFTHMAMTSLSNNSVVFSQQPVAVKP